MTVPLMSIRGLSKSFPASNGYFEPPREVRAVAHFDLDISPGETIGLAGESGCGKSTVAKLIMGLIPPSTGSIVFAGREISSLSRGELFSFRKDVQMIFQDPFSSLNPRLRVGDIIGEALTIHRLAKGENRRLKVMELLEKVGLRAEHYDRYPHEFSGGQRQRIGIARTLAVSPRLIIADEPVSALDLSIQAQIINLLQELKKEFSLSFLFIAHDLSVVRHMSDRIAIMYLGRIVETGPREEIFNRFLHPYTEALLSAIPRIDPGEREKRIILSGDLPSPLAVPSGCPFHTRCPYAKPPLCTDVFPPLESKEDGHQAACHFSRELYR